VALFALGAVAANAYPLADTSQSVVVTSIHLPIALWLVVGLAYVADDWRSSRRRMDFIRFTGEWFVYFVLIALGGGVLIAFMFGTFEAIGIVPEEFITQWLLPCGVVAAIVVAGWLVEAKQNVVENIAPVLARLFTPLFTTLEQVAGLYRSGGWPAQVEDDALTAPFSAPSAGPPPWHLYRFTFHTAVGVATAEPHGATRWRFPR
jgi:hypothetical protein